MKKKVTILLIGVVTLALLQGCKVTEIAGNMFSSGISSNAPTFGEDNIEYKGFDYMKGVELTDDNGNTQKIYIPKSAGSNSKDGSIDASVEGISVTACLSPINKEESDNEEDEGESATLQEIVGENTNSFPGLIRYYQGNTVAECNDGYFVEDSYFGDDDHSAENYMVYRMFFGKEMNEEVAFLLTVSIDSRDVTKETEKALEEIEYYYGIDSKWTTEYVLEQQTSFNSSDEKNKNYVYISPLQFELPDKWLASGTGSSDEYYAFAPNGDADEAKQFVSLYKDEMEFEKETEEFLTEEASQAITKSVFGDECKVLASKEVSDTIFSRTLLYEVRFGEDQEKTARLYIGCIDSDVYYIIAEDWSDDPMECFGAAEVMVNEGRFNRKTMED